VPKHRPVKCQKWGASSPESAIYEPPRCWGEEFHEVANLHGLAVTGPALSAECAATAVSAAIARSADYVTVSEKLLELLRCA
jgi:hypothetical protein